MAMKLTEENKRMLALVSDEIKRQGHTLMLPRPISLMDSKSGIEWRIIGLYHETKGCNSWQHTKCDLYRQKSSFGEFAGELKSCLIKDITEEALAKINNQIINKN